MRRDVRGTRWLGETWQDLRFAVRLLIKERWFAAAAVLTTIARRRRAPASASPLLYEEAVDPAVQVLGVMRT